LIAAAFENRWPDDVRLSLIDQRFLRQAWRRGPAGFWACTITEKIPQWVIHVILTVVQPLQVYPDQRISSDRPGWSG
jgi:hypothetical protein